jgi:hypothetical protein
MVGIPDLEGNIPTDENADEDFFALWNVSSNASLGLCLSRYRAFTIDCFPSRMIRYPMPYGINKLAISSLAVEQRKLDFLFTTSLYADLKE